MDECEIFAKWTGGAPFPDYEELLLSLCVPLLEMLGMGTQVSTRLE